MLLAISKLLRDPVNVGIVNVLVAEPRIATTALARRIGMSAPAVRERIQRLEEAGVLTGYRTLVDPAALGYPITIFIRIRPMPGRVNQIGILAREIPNVVECHRITGEDCFIIKAHLASLDALDGLLDRFLVYGETTTSIAQSCPVPARQLPLPVVK
jgi:Lrp/AsnC family transcriptional regulator, leucine-responsive regulatory protein